MSLSCCPEATMSMVYGMAASRSGHRKHRPGTCPSSRSPAHSGETVHVVSTVTVYCLSAGTLGRSMHALAQGCRLAPAWPVAVSITSEALMELRLRLPASKAPVGTVMNKQVEYQLESRKNVYLCAGFQMLCVCVCETEGRHSTAHHSSPYHTH